MELLLYTGISVCYAVIDLVSLKQERETKELIVYLILVVAIVATRIYSLLVQ